VRGFFLGIVYAGFCPKHVLAHDTNERGDAMALNAQNEKWYALGFSIFSFLMLSGSLFFLFDILEIRASREWPHTRGTITASFSAHTCGSSKSFHTWEGRISYRYVVNSIEHGAQRVAGYPIYCDSKLEAVTAWLNANYPLGKEVEVYFNPANPDAAFLHPGKVRVVDVVMVFACAIISGLAAYGLLLARRRVRRLREASNRCSTHSPSAQP
jgi:hypothetical protein